MTVAARSALSIGVLALASWAGAFTCPADLRGQTVGSERIVAVVGDDAILLSELEEQTVIAAGEAGLDEKDSAAVNDLRREVLEQMIADLVVVESARADDSLDVSPSSVNEAVEAELNEIRGRFPSPAEFDREISLSQWRTLDNYKRNLRRIKERELLAQAFLQKNAARIPAPPVSDDEVRRYYDENQARFGDKPPNVKIRQLNLLVRPTDPTRERARALADSLLAEVRGGASFTELAKQYSDDTQSAQKGGDLGYFKHGAMVQAFEEAVFGIDSIGGLAGPVETEFGFHIIRLEDRQGEEIRARHILVTPEISDADRAAARTLGLALVDSLAGGADFDSLAEHHGTGGRMEPAAGPLNQLPLEWQQALKDLPVGATTGLLETPAGFAILKLEEKTASGPYTFAELEPRIRSQLMQTRGQKEFIDALQKSVYVDVRMPEAGAAALPAAAASPAGAPSLDQSRGDRAVEPAAPATGLGESPPAEPGEVPAEAERLPAAEPPPIGAAATDSLPQVEPPAPGTPARALPEPAENPPVPKQPFENPPPLADTPPADVQNPPLTPGELGLPVSPADSLPAGPAPPADSLPAGSPPAPAGP